jgi:hypothetical protein
MIDWKFYIDDLEIEEPGGFADIIFAIARDEDWHGVFFEASASELLFYDEAFEYLQTKKLEQGLKAEAIFKALQRCDEDDEFEEAISGKLNFSKYRESFGNSCRISINVEQENCTMLIRNRYDQKVDMETLKGFDGFTSLEDYSAMGRSLEIPTKEIYVAIEGYVGDEPNTVQGDVLAGTNNTAIIRPTYSDERFNNIATGQLIPFGDLETNDNDEPGPISPQLLYEETPRCFSGQFNYNFRQKGVFEINLQAGDGLLVHTKLKVVKWDGQGTVITDADIVQEIDLGISGPLPFASTPFDEVLSGIVNLVEGESLYAFIEFFTGGTTNPYGPDYSVTWDPITYMKIDGVKACEPTVAITFMVNESLSRAVEAITNNCTKLKSDYYGRTDAEPYPSDVDGCGALRVLTSGLFLRNAEKPKLFLSLKDLFEGLNPIDNIGFGIEDDPARPGMELLVVEDVSYFYRDEEILSLPFVPEGDLALEESEHYSLIKSGYEKWETEGTNGLDEFNSTREYRTSLSAVNNTKPIVSKFIAGGYPIEITRQQNFVDTGAADTKYDNDTFIISVKRNIYGFEVEQGNIDNPANLYSPQTILNWRIRPYSNLMRWFKSIANSYPNLIDSDNKLFFSSGTGNITAEGELNSAECKLENGVKAENRNLSKIDFATEDYKPLWKPESAKFKYSLSIKDYKKIKANPYGYISFQKGTGDYVKAFIKSIRYVPTKGEAEFNLRLAWQ